MKKPIIIVLLCLACGLFSCTQTEPRPTTTDLITNNRIINKIHNNRGLFSSSKTLEKYIDNINTDNVIDIVFEYNWKYGKSIFNEILRNVFISSKTRAKAVKHIKDMYMQALKSKGVYTDDYDILIEGHIEYEKNKFGRMKSKDIDEDLRDLFDRQWLMGKINYKLIPANGKIDATFNQGLVMDCWLLSAIKSVSLNPKGLEMLEDLISLDDKGNVTVQLKGVKRVYTISKEELEGANEFAQGDLDVRAIEIAVYRYLHEIENHSTLFKRVKSYVNGSPIWPWNNFHDGMNYLCTSYCILFGNEWCPDNKPDKETIEKIKSGDYSIIVLSNNQYYMKGFSKHHVYAVTTVDDNNVFFSDPYNPDKNFAMTHDDFLKFFDQSHSMPY